MSVATLVRFDAERLGHTQHMVLAELTLTLHAGERVALLSPIFARPMPVADLVDRARRARADYLLFTRRDPVWLRLGGPPATLPCLYRTADLCIAPARKEMLP